MKITLAQIEQFFKENGGTDKCPFCDNYTWMILCPPGADATHDAQFEPYITQYVMSNSSGNAGYTTITLGCSRCGFMRAHFVQPIQAWLDKQGEAL